MQKPLAVAEMTRWDSFRRKKERRKKGVSPSTTISARHRPDAVD
jgi:hypothetical protein